MSNKQPPPVLHRIVCYLIGRPFRDIQPINFITCLQISETTTNILYVQPRIFKQFNCSTMTNIFNDALVYLPRTKSYGDYDHKLFESKKSFVPKKQNKENGTNHNGQITRGASFVVGHKLRESKWFTHEEMKIFLAVVETGFIVEIQNEVYGVAIWTPGYGE